MREREWLATGSVRLRDWVQKHLPNARRKQRLFACACCRRLWDHLPDERSRAVVVAAEDFADGKIEKKVLTSLRRDAARAAARAPAPPHNSGAGWGPADTAECVAAVQSWTDV